VSVLQADLGVPRPLVGLRAAVWAARCLAVVPDRFDEQPAGVVIAGFGDVTAVALVAAGVFAGNDPQPRAQLAWVTGAREVANLGDQPERRFVEIPRKRTSTTTGSRQRSRCAICSRSASSAASCRSRPSRKTSICSRAACASALSRRCPAIQAHTSEAEGLRDVMRCRDDLRCARTAARHRVSQQLLRHGGSTARATPRAVSLGPLRDEAQLAGPIEPHESSSHRDDRSSRDPQAGLGIHAGAIT
jgi:hypothetical protein